MPERIFQIKMLDHLWLYPRCGLIERNGQAVVIADMRDKEQRSGLPDSGLFTAEQFDKKSGPGSRDLIAWTTICAS